METQTPIQIRTPKHVQREAYQRIPMTCNLLRSILDECMQQVMTDLDIDPAEQPTLDASFSQAFLRIRDEITQKFRDEQMILLTR